MSGWNSLVQSTTQHLVTSLSVHPYVTPTFHTYATSFLTSKDYENACLARTLEGICAYPSCPKERNEVKEEEDPKASTNATPSRKDDGSSRDESSPNNESSSSNPSPIVFVDGKIIKAKEIDPVVRKLPFYSKPLRFCSDSCLQCYKKRQAEIEKMKPVSLRDGILQLVHRSNPDITPKRLVAMREKSIGLQRTSKILKDGIKERVSSETNEKAPIIIDPTKPTPSTAKNQLPASNASSPSSVVESTRLSNIHTSPSSKNDVPSDHSEFQIPNDDGKKESFQKNDESKEVNHVEKQLESSRTPSILKTQMNGLDSVSPKTDLNDSSSEPSIPKKKVQFKDIEDAKSGENPVMSIELFERKNTAPPPEIMESWKTGKEITLEGYVIPRAFDQEMSTEAREAINPSIDSEDDSSSIDYNDEMFGEGAKKPLRLSFSEEYNAREMFYGFSDSDSDIEEEGSIDMRSYLNGNSNNYSSYQRLFITISRWMSEEASNYLNRFNARYKPVQPKPQVVEDEELKQMRKAFESINLDPEGPRSNSGPTTSELKKPTRKRKAPPTLTQSINTQKSVSAAIEKPTIEEKNPAELELERESNLRYERYVGTHIALNDPCYKRYQAAMTNIKRVLPKIGRLLNLRQDSVNQIATQIDSFLSRMSHIDPPTCVNDHDWEILSIIIIEAMQSCGSLILDERPFDGTDHFVLTNYVIQNGLSEDNFNALVECMANGF